MSQFDQKAILLAALLQIQKEVLVPGEGICFNVEIATFNTEGADDLALHTMMVNIWRKWPEFSGNHTYPVPHEDCNPMSTFHSFDSLWEGEYGDTRKRLLAFLITQLQGETE